MKRLLLTAALAVLTAPGAAVAQRSTALAELPNESLVTAYAGLVVVSVHDAATPGFHLTLVRGPGRQERLPVPPSAEPFDADLGPDVAGRPTVVYSRCADPRDSTSCAVFSHRIGAAGEQPVRSVDAPAAGEREPSLWRGELAWIRSYGPERDVAYVRSLRAPASSRSVRQPGLPTRNCDVQFERGDCTTRNRALVELELRGSRLAVLGTYSVTNQVGFRTSELRLVDRRAGRSRRIALVTSGEGGQSLVGPSFSGPYLGWTFSCFGDPGGCRARGAHRYRIATDRYEVERVYRSFAGFSLDGDGAYGLDGLSELGDPPSDEFPPCNGRSAAGKPARTCPLLRLGPLAWEPVAARRVRGR